MNEWFKKFFATIKEKWAKWTIVQKGIVIGIVVVIIAAIVILSVVSSKPTTAYLYSAPILNESERDAILYRLDQDNVKTYVSSDGRISVENETIARRYRSKLIAEGFAPSGLDPYSLFDTTSWTRNDFDDEVKWKRAMESAVAQHISDLDGVMTAKVILTLPEKALFASAQNPVTASVIVTAKPGSDILSDKNQIRAIQRLVTASVEGLQDSNIVIVDGATNKQVNDFEGMEETDRITNIDRQQKLILKYESEYSSAVLNSLKATYGDKRVRIANMKIDMNMSKRTTTTKEFFGVTLVPDNPDTPFDDSQVVPSLERSHQKVTKEYTGTGFNPEGPAGVEGQNPPVMSDMSNMIGKSTEVGETVNNELNERNIVEETSPQIDRVTVAVNIDGVWTKVLDNKGNYKITEAGGIERAYTPISERDLAQVTKLVQDAVGYNKNRGDSVTVINVAFDHKEEFEAEDLAYRKAQQTRKTILFSLLGVAVVLIAFIIFRIISREIERRRRLREEELLRKQQAEREQALWDAKEQGMEVTMSVEERKRAELQENAVAMAKEHPEDVAMLIRTWLMEE